MPTHAPIYVDHTHCGGRHVTGLERITLELFSPDALAPLSVTPITADSRRAMMVRQTLLLPWLLARNPGAILLAPGFPPSPLATLFGARVVPYIHDLFLRTRWSDLNRRAKLYMAAPFRLAVARLPRFFVNSQTTADALRCFCRPNAEILLYRPQVRNVFDLVPHAADTRHVPRAPRLVALGTVEPRKNFAAAAALLAALRQQGFADATLDIVGRVGWDDGADALRRVPGVTLHGYQSEAFVKAALESADLLLSTSHDEGLGLPLLEAQYAGLPVVAPDKPVFREVLGASGLFVDTQHPDDAAAHVAGLLRSADRRAVAMQTSLANLARWNDLAQADHTAAIDAIARLSHAVASRSGTTPASSSRPDTQSLGRPLAGP